MKPITLHPVSVLAGLALAGLAVVATGAAQTPVPTRTVFVGEVPAEWWTFVEVLSSPPTSYTVPTGKRFVVTSCSSYWNSNPLLEDGQQAGLRISGVMQYSNTGTQIGNGTRVVFEPGTLLTTDGGGHRLWGYLEPVR
jgi:hypothetical protein